MRAGAAGADSSASIASITCSVEISFIGPGVCFGRKIGHRIVDPALQNRQQDVDRGRQ